MLVVSGRRVMPVCDSAVFLWRGDKKLSHLLLRWMRW